MRQTSLSGIVRRWFLHLAVQRQIAVPQIVADCGIAPGDFCRIIANQNMSQISLPTYYRLSRWLHMPLAYVTALAPFAPKLEDIVRLGMVVRALRATSTQDQVQAAQEAGISVAVFRRSLHGYANHTPSLQTCDRLAAWLHWSGYTPDEIAASAGLMVRYTIDGVRQAVPREVLAKLEPYPCACHRPGCMVPAHIPSGPRRIWRSDACRMWAKRHSEQVRQSLLTEAHTLPSSATIVRFIAINERRLPVRQ